MNKFQSSAITKIYTVICVVDKLKLFLSLSESYFIASTLQSCSMSSKMINSNNSIKWIQKLYEALYDYLQTQFHKLICVLK